MTRLWPEGVLIDVVEDGGGKPDHLIWQGRNHTVSLITRRWRVRSDWWRDPVWRDYFKIITKSGLLLIIFHDLNSDKWFLQRLFD